MSADESPFGTMPPAHAVARDRVRQFVRAQMAARTPPMTNGALARKAGINRDTIGDFLGGRSWPQPSRLAAIEAALDLEAGSLDRVFNGQEPQAKLTRSAENGPVTTASPALVVTFSAAAVSDLSPTERDEVEAAARAAALRRIREIRGQ
jgi:transcriptional regulator with XRE-family HTH domain